MAMEELEEWRKGNIRLSNARAGAGAPRRSSRPCRVAPMTSARFVHGEPAARQRRCYQRRP